jgi:hypothetical protein
VREIRSRRAPRYKPLLRQNLVAFI